MVSIAGDGAWPGVDGAMIPVMDDDLAISREQAVIASILLDSRVLRFATAECVPADFGDHSLGAIFNGITQMYGRREPIDVITVADRLSDWDVRGIGPADLHSWTSEVPHAQHVGAYAAQVRKDSLSRGLRMVASSLAAGGDPGVKMSEAVDELRRLRDGHTISPLVSKSLGQVLAGDDDYDWVIPGLLERRDRMLLTGVEGGGKSMLIRQLAVMAAAGLHPFTFFKMPPVRVLVVDAENSEKQWRRASKVLVSKASSFGVADPARTVQLVCAARMDLSRDADLGQLHRLMDEQKPDVLFIGPLYRLIPRAINSDDDATPLLAALDTLRERGVAMVIEAHAGHAMGSGGERDLRPRGSAALLGWPEFGFGLRPDKNGRSSREFQLVRWRGDRDERKWPTRISRGASEWPWTPTVPF